MNISIEKLLAKMETELHSAKTSGKEENLREKIYSIKILCELILDEKTGKSNEAMIHTAPASFLPAAAKPISGLNQPKKLETDDGANGDSLFDF